MPSWKRLSAVFVLLLLGMAARRDAQTFRGGIAGRVADSTGAVLPGVTVTATNDATGVARTTTTSTAGDFSVPDLQLGTYTIEATLQGFQTLRTKVEVTRLADRVGGAEDGAVAGRRDDQRHGVGADCSTPSRPRSATSSGPSRCRTCRSTAATSRGMLQLAPGVAGTSVNGVRTRGNNFQIDGADNNDAFQNAPAVNQGGVSGIAGTLLPIEAIDQFSVQSGGQAEMGRNAGSTVNLVIKSGTNDFHGSAFYFNRNEALVGELAGRGARLRRSGRFATTSTASRSADPIVHNKTFFFSTLEVQKLTAGNTIPTTTPSAAWVAQATQLLGQFGVPVNPVSTNMLALWPAASRTGRRRRLELRQHGRRTPTAAPTASPRSITTSTRSTACRRATSAAAATRSRRPTRRTSPTSRRCRAGCTTSRWSATSVFTSHLVNQLVVGYNYFKQTFNSNDTSFDPIAMGFNTGVTDPTLAGPPNMTINGFAAVGGTQPLGRVDKTLHFTDSISYSTGAHQMKFGGEARMADLFVFYDSNKRGTFTYDGTVGPWASLPASQASASLKSLADFMAGSYATGIIVQGNTHHDYVQNSADLFFQDVVVRDVEADAQLRRCATPIPACSAPATGR